MLTVSAKIVIRLKHLTRKTNETPQNNEKIRENPLKRLRLWAGQFIPSVALGNGHDALAALSQGTQLGLRFFHGGPRWTDTKIKVCQTWHLPKPIKCLKKPLANEFSLFDFNRVRQEPNWTWCGIQNFCISCSRKTSPPGATRIESNSKLTAKHLPTDPWRNRPNKTRPQTGWKTPPPPRRHPATHLQKGRRMKGALCLPWRNASNEQTS